MEYNYLHERPAENRLNPESGQGHPQNQQGTPYQHQQYPPTHPAFQPGYPGLRFAPFLNSLQSPGSVPGQLSTQEGLLHPSISPTDPTPTTTSRGPAHRSHDFGNVLMHVGGTPLQFRPDVATSPHGIPHQQLAMPSATVTSPPPGHNLPPDQTYEIQDLSVSSISNLTTSQSNINASANVTNSSTTLSTVTPIVRKKSASAAPRQRLKKSNATGTTVQVAEPPQVQREIRRDGSALYWNKACQTLPLFDENQLENEKITMPSDLPDGLVYVEMLEETGSKKALITTKDFEEGREFGPFTGDFVNEGLGCYNPSTWEICVKGKTWFYIDGSTDPNNWMTHVKVAQSLEKQNLEAFQRYGDIFFRTTREIKGGTELKVFYSEEYRKRVGFKMGLEDAHMNMDCMKFVCEECQCRYTNVKSLLRHYKFEHDEKNNPHTGEVASHLAGRVDVGKIRNLEEKLAGIRHTKHLESKRAKDRRKEQELAKEKAKYFKKKLPVSDLSIFKTTPDKADHNQDDDKDAEESFSCKQCGKNFPSEGRLRMHASFHQEARTLKPVCEICGLECKHNRALKQHLLSHDSNSYQCQKCGKYFKRKSCFVYHLRHDHKLFVGEKWMRGNLLEKMERYVGPDYEQDAEEGPFHPDLPKDMLGKRILLVSKKPKVFKCKYCPKTFSEHHLVFRHEKTIHTNSGRYKCQYCPTSFMEEYRYILHTRKHTKDRPYKCPLCSRSFSSEQALENHQPEHRGERPFMCDVCGKGFRRRKYLTNHKRRLHQPPTQLLNCSFCEKVFRSRTSLNRHERCHKGIRPHVCLTCGKAFGTKFSLQSHELIHTGERNYVCKVCDKRFLLNHHLVAHMLRHERQGPKNSDLVIALSKQGNGATSNEMDQDFAEEGDAVV